MRFCYFPKYFLYCDFFLGIMIIYCDLQLNREKIYFYFFIIKRMDNMDGYITSRIANPLFGVHIVERKQIYTQMNSLVYLQIESGR